MYNFTVALFKEVSTDHDSILSLSRPAYLVICKLTIATLVLNTGR